MVRRQWTTRISLILGAEVLFPGWGWGQEPISKQTIESLFYDLWPLFLLACILTAVLTAVAIRYLLRHRGRGHFPSRVRRVALLVGMGWTLLAGIAFLVEGWQHGIPPLLVFSAPINLAVPVAFAVLWYLVVYFAFRVRRWSGLYALWPARLMGDRS